MRVAVAGSGVLSLSILRALEDSCHEVVAVVQEGRKVRGVKRRIVPVLSGIFAASTTASGYARKRGIPILYIDTMSEDELNPFRDLNLDLLLVAGFSIILKPPLLELPTIGCVNCHPSLLPLHRGPNPFSAVVLANRTETGVTFHVMEPDIDTGDILGQFPIPLDENETAGTVYNKTSKVAGERVVEVLDRIASEGLQGTPQDHANATYEKKMQKEELYLDWRESAVDLERKIRACVPFAFPRFRAQGKNVYITKAVVDAEPHDAEAGTVLATHPFAKIATGEGALELRVTYTLSPIPWIWPPRFLNVIHVGNKLE